MSHADGSVDEEAPTQVFARPGARSLARAPVWNPDALWDANDVARYLKVSRSWVYQRAEAGLLACVRIGGLLRFDPLTVRTFACGGPDSQPRAGLSGLRKGKIR